MDAEQIALYQKLKATGRLPIRTVLTWRPDASQPTATLQQEIRGSAVHHQYRRLVAQVRHIQTDPRRWHDHRHRVPAAPLRGVRRSNYTARRIRTIAGSYSLLRTKLLAVMRTARNRGWQLTTHDQGGGAVDNFLDTLEALDREKPIAPTRSHVMHASFQSPEAIARMKKMGILADVQAPWLYLDGPALEKVFGYDGMRWFYPLRSYIDAGIIVAAGSDHMIGHDKNNAVNPYNPFHEHVDRSDSADHSRQGDASGAKNYSRRSAEDAYHLGSVLAVR